MADGVHANELVDELSDYGSLRPGKRLGRYELLVPIARGGMARVWAARLHGQRGFQKLVAIKTILPSLAEEPEFERMFLDEARIASGVHHPNVCEIYELGEEKHTLYLAMEWVSGDSLSRVLRPSGKQVEPLDPRVAARIIADACAGVHAAHELTDEDGRHLDVVHRDLSPHNVLLSADGVAKVCDFGVAKALGQLHEATSAGQLKGKLSYMSPEQITGGSVDRRSDVFSLGCVLYEATTGERPFKGDRDYVVMKAIVDGEIMPPSKIVRGYPLELERIVLRALSNKPILRYPTAERMRFALEELLTRGSLVTQANVAQVIRTRIGELLDKRKERIRLASSAAEQGTWDPAQAQDRPRDPAEHRSGVKPSRSRMEVGETPEPAPSIPPVPPTIPHAFSSDDTVVGHGADFGVPPSSDFDASATITQQLDPAVAAPPGEGVTKTLPLPVEVPPHVVGLQAPDVRPPLDSFARAPYPPSPSSTIPPRSSPRDPASTMSLPAEAHGGTVQYAIAALVGVLAAAIIGGGAFYAWRRNAAAPARVAEAPAPSPPPVPKGAETAAAPAAPPPIVLQTVPSDAVLVVDGVELAADVRTIPRPPAGRTVAVVARAGGYEDASMLVDYFTTTPVVLSLKPAPEPRAARPEAPSPAPSAKPRSKPRAASPALPDNPY